MPTLQQTMSPLQQREWVKTMQKAGQQAAINMAVVNGVINLHRVLFDDAVEAFVTKDPDTLKVKDKALKLATVDDPVLILGESGTGKELLARIMHGERKGPFVAVNVTAVTDTLFESELFGHVRGAFTGADTTRTGLIGQAEGGTLFLDEIGDMPLHTQAKILRVVQHRVFRKVGSNVDETVNCRITAATHRELRSMILKNTFRLDLYERLNVFSIRIKPIRDRLDDMHNYVTSELYTYITHMEHFKSYNEQGHAPEWYAMYPLLSGNVRQLMNLQKRWNLFGSEDIKKEDIL